MFRSVRAADDGQFLGNPETGAGNREGRAAFVAARESPFDQHRLRARTDLQNSQFLRVVGENAELKAGLELLTANPESAEARATVEDQVGELCTRMGFDFLLVSNAEGRALAGVLRTEAGVMPVAAPGDQPHASGLMMIGERVYQLASVAIDQGEDNVGELSVGERFDLADFNTPAVLLRNGVALESNIPGMALGKIDGALKGCRGAGECEVRLDGQSYLSLPMDGASLGDGYQVRSLQSVDAASAPLQSVLNRVFLSAAFGVVLVTCCSSARVRRRAL